MKKKITNILKIIYPIAVYFIITIGITLILKVLRITIETEDVIRVLITEQVIAAAVILGIYKFQNSASILEKYHYKLSDFGMKNIILVLLTTYFVLGSISLISLVLNLHESYPGYSEIYDVISSGPLLLQVISTVIMAPVLEEVLCRGIIYNRMREMSNFYVSALISSLIWAIAHLNMVQGVTALLFGLFLAFLYEKFKMLWITILSHGLFNLIAVVSGYVSTFPENGQEVNGSESNLTANIIALIFNILIAGWLISVLHRSKFPRKKI